jgi:hypothetical protein
MKEKSTPILADAIERLAIDQEHVGQIAGGFVELAHYLYEDKLGQVLSRTLTTTDEETGNLVNVAGGLLAIAEGLNNIAAALNNIDNLSHSICMGIRKGLFGADADSGRSILELRPDDE